ncbi:hypothetical protein EOW77_0003650 [Bradyrhizobium yuanmingense]|uniref:hypothetical protein n=1 Tax=Bradyrhizobium yuanmingense TaxID=108015 RepID=UPI000FE2E3FC|nr:hypothetical protein [Bradyrhizobium yuanmingense]TGN89431.1 hypothetical protein EOW77_0003650 [Bradyrhizobium yuanmingense]
MIRFAKAALCVAALSLVAVLAIDPNIAAFAADAAAPETVAHATGEATKVTWALGATVSQWADAFEAIAVAAVAFLLRKIPGQFGGILMTMHVDQVLNKAIDYAINMVKGATKDKELSLDVGNEVLAKALQYVLDHAPTWLQSWMGGPEQIAQKIIARLNLAPDAVPTAGAVGLAGLSAENIASLKSILAKVG